MVVGGGANGNGDGVIELLPAPKEMDTTSHNFVELATPSRFTHGVQKLGVSGYPRGYCLFIHWFVTKLVKQLMEKNEPIDQHIVKSQNLEPRNGTFYRTDPYIYGHPSGRKYRSFVEFTPHLKFLTSATSAPKNYTYCVCVFCADLVKSNRMLYRQLTNLRVPSSVPTKSVSALLFRKGEVVWVSVRIDGGELVGIEMPRMGVKMFEDVESDLGFEGFFWPARIVSREIVKDGDSGGAAEYPDAMYTVRLLFRSTILNITASSLLPFSRRFPIPTYQLPASLETQVELATAYLSAISHAGAIANTWAVADPHPVANLEAQHNPDPATSASDGKTGFEYGILRLGAEYIREGDFVRVRFDSETDLLGVCRHLDDGRVIEIVQGPPGTGVDFPMQEPAGRYIMRVNRVYAVDEGEGLQQPTVASWNVKVRGTVYKQQPEGYEVNVKGENGDTVVLPAWATLPGPVTVPLCAVRGVYRLMKRRVDVRKAPERAVKEGRYWMHPGVKGDIEAVDAYARSVDPETAMGRGREMWGSTDMPISRKLEGEWRERRVGEIVSVPRDPFETVEWDEGVDLNQDRFEENKIRGVASSPGGGHRRASGFPSSPRAKPKSKQDVSERASVGPSTPTLNRKKRIRGSSFYSDAFERDVPLLVLSPLRNPLKSIQTSSRFNAEDEDEEEEEQVEAGYVASRVGPMSRACGERTASSQPHEPRSTLTELERVQIVELLHRLESSRYAPPFLNPVDEIRDNAPEYHAIVLHPVDLSTMSLRLQGLAEPSYTRVEDFVEDMRRMKSNAELYNGEEHWVAKAAGQMWKRFVGFCRVARCEGWLREGELTQSAGEKGGSSTPKVRKRRKTGSGTGSRAESVAESVAASTSGELDVGKHDEVVAAEQDMRQGEIRESAGVEEVVEVEWMHEGETTSFCVGVRAVTNAVVTEEKARKIVDAVKREKVRMMDVARVADAAGYFDGVGRRGIVGCHLNVRAGSENSRDEECLQRWKTWFRRFDAFALVKTESYFGLLGVDSDDEETDDREVSNPFAMILWPKDEGHSGDRMLRGDDHLPDEMASLEVEPPVGSSPS
ncbi:hypothetical protein BJ742DRAFT_312549 [Cladochytrium replicatum]|nr:hypothetical protein BJ742DRAFT_312549 [Cladochytrium replicatum]